ncbi:2-succinyl-5-enolpyruvyl-6-hydroxy-3-cyclohexene-1-carboxylic-acid synthase [Demequina sp. NBRC 110055]|uniref:2-succinyl-5-enolpyruvyl-6-hydroxy-3- cyclohexene-1-carboxylic-acid synthase n=1 Tax=Demequina sp. NBRC 110055 TaxID=1570344 RepID=UPI000A06F203|nr:2-succinyl-5-enolpyruvyl-6-hydroxy-3-cyclohexene-1-carboxylic-acid synthase [Demequina sp. NBRC 110055]
MSYPSAAFARELVATLAQRGVREFVLCPGSRSGPLAHALAEAGADNPPLGAPGVDLHVRIDERSAAFLALGLARGAAATGQARAVAIVTTSGTAVGNLMPAVMEAHHSGLPLLLLTADRPGELRGVGANQTTDQVGIFGTFVRWSADVAAPADGDAPGHAARLATQAVGVALGDPNRDDMTGTPGPVHLNLEFRDPLSTDNGVWDDPPHVDAHPSTGSHGIPMVDEPAPLPEVERGLVIAGDGAGPAARLIAEAHGWPLLAEPTSGAREGDACIPRYLDLLAADAGRTLANQVHQVVVVGRPTLTRQVQRLIADAPALMVAGHGARWREAPRHAERVLRGVPASWTQRSDGTLALGDSAWLARWREAASVLEPQATSWDRRAVASAFLESLTPGEPALLGSSGSIRAVDQVAPAWEVGDAPVLVANRGLAGIDGTVATAVGMALAARRPVSALMGDVTFLHDVGGLLIGPRETRPRVRIVVINDGGGTIFGGLEHASAPPPNVERVFTTPHGVDLAPLAAAYGVRHTRVTNADALARALASPVTGMELVEAVVRA